MDIDNEISVDFDIGDLSDSDTISTYSTQQFTLNGIPNSV